MLVTGVLHPASEESNSSTYAEFRPNEMARVAQACVGKPVLSGHEGVLVGKVTRATLEPEGHITGDLMIDLDTPEGMACAQAVRRGELRYFSWGGDTYRPKDKPIITGFGINEMSLVDEPYFDECTVQGYDYPLAPGIVERYTTPMATPVPPPPVVPVADVPVQTQPRDPAGRFATPAETMTISPESVAALKELQTLFGTNSGPELALAMQNVMSAHAARLEAEQNARLNEVKSGNVPAWIQESGLEADAENITQALTRYVDAPTPHDGLLMRVIHAKNGKSVGDVTAQLKLEESANKIRMMEAALAAKDAQLEAVKNGLVQQPGDAFAKKPSSLDQVRSIVIPVQHSRPSQAPAPVPAPVPVQKALATLNFGSGGGDIYSTDYVQRSRKIARVGS